MNPLGWLEAGLKILDKVIPDPIQRAEAQVKLLEAQQAGEFKELDARYGAILAEAQSNDPWTSRARPSFMYVFYFILIALVVVAPVMGVFFPLQMDLFFTNVQSGFQAVPEELWWTFTAGYLGYTTARTYEKQKGVA